MVERKGREKAVACRRVERTAIGSKRVRGNLEGEVTMGRKLGCRCRCLCMFTLCTFSGSVQLLDPSDDIDSGKRIRIGLPKSSVMLTLQSREFGQRVASKAMIFSLTSDIADGTNRVAIFGTNVVNQE